MTLLITLIAAVTVTLIWYTSEKARKMKTGILCYMFWGASLMWLVDAAVEYIEDGADYFIPSSADMLNDAFLGLSAVVLALVVWMVYILIKDPKKRFVKH
ncbi:MAG: hypothetical protein IKN85_01800 [Oscillospiraceae bacterium]|nr:hypothetical protein [Oscillospiraceae bacterium]MBR3534540.1 hypothetical protein [Oscillospiraceae bacterium]MBR6837471.1 hypothetical protein [Oscillospiraceae bacterium]MBR6924129.1 hypothetical protein [Oscillospiraceae bacterium]